MPFKLKTVTEWVEMDFMSGGMQSSAAANRSRSHAACRWPPTSFTRFRSRELYFIFVSFVHTLGFSAQNPSADFYRLFLTSTEGTPLFLDSS